MKYNLKRVLMLAAILGMVATGLANAQGKTLVCVGLYSETSDGYVSYKAGGDWIVVKVGDKIPASAQVKINVDRDWVEFITPDNPNAVYEIDGPESGGQVIKTVPEILKMKPRVVSFPKGAADPKFKDKLVVRQYLGRQIYTNPAMDDKDIKYGDVLENKGKVRIIAINNTITLMNSSGKVTTVIGPLNFEVAKVLNNEKLYKFLNVPK